MATRFLKISSNDNKILKYNTYFLKEKHIGHVTIFALSVWTTLEVTSMTASACFRHQMDFGLKSLSQFGLIFVVVIGNWLPFYFRWNLGGHRSAPYLDFVYFGLGYPVNHDLVRSDAVPGAATDHVTFSA